MPNDTLKMVSVPRAALEFVLENASFWDCGPSDEGWPSPEMRAAEDALRNALRAGQCAM